MSKAIPHGFHVRDPVKITSSQLRGPKLGLVMEACKYDDGIMVWIVSEGAKYVCVIPDREGDSIVPLSKGP